MSGMIKEAEFQENGEPIELHSGGFYECPNWVDGHYCGTLIEIPMEQLLSLKFNVTCPACGDVVEGEVTFSSG